MKILKIFTILLLLSLAVFSCDSGSSSKLKSHSAAANQGGPSNSPTEVPSSALPAEEPSQTDLSTVSNNGVVTQDTSTAKTSSTTSTTASTSTSSSSGTTSNATSVTSSSGSTSTDTSSSTTTESSAATNTGTGTSATDNADTTSTTMIETTSPTVTPSGDLTPDPQLASEKEETTSTASNNQPVTSGSENISSDSSSQTSSTSDNTTVASNQQTETSSSGSSSSSSTVSESSNTTNDQVSSNTESSTETQSQSSSSSTTEQATSKTDSSTQTSSQSSSSQATTDENSILSEVSAEEEITADDSSDSNYDLLSDEIENAKPDGKTIFSLDTTAGKWYTTTDKKDPNKDTIWTFWPDQDLDINVKNVSEAGWYKITLSAKNYNGPLPTDYGYFNFTVYNSNKDSYLGGFSVKASDSKYNSGGTYVYLNKGDNTLVLNWTNDAYKSNVYDANVQIKTVNVAYSKKQVFKNSLIRTAFQYSKVDGRFFWDKYSAYTFWPDQKITFSFQNLKPGKYRVYILAKNYGNVPSGYDKFKVKVGSETNNASSIAEIAADAKHFNRGFAVLNLKGGDTDVSLTWINDKWVPEKDQDSNIVYKRIRLQKIGEYEKSGLAAYIMGIDTMNRMFITMALVILITAVSGISIYNRRKTKSIK